jgi:hypothetical protein
MSLVLGIEPGYFVVDGTGKEDADMTRFISESNKYINGFMIGEDLRKLGP